MPVRHSSTPAASTAPALSPLNDAIQASEQSFEASRENFRVVPLTTESDIDGARRDAQHRAVRLESALDALGEFAHRWGEGDDDMDASVVIALSSLLALGSEEAGRVAALLDHADLAESQLGKGGAR